MSAPTLLPPRHLLTVDDLGPIGIRRIMDLTDRFTEVSARAIPKVPALRGKTVAWLFYEDSTRTRLSFETAAKRLSADSMNFSVSSSAVKKGESLRDTVQTISAMGVDAIVVRHSQAGTPAQITEWTDASIINAGDGWHSHPTQGLLDVVTAQRNVGDLAGKRVALIGDIKHSRVARSVISAFSALGATVTLVAPPTLLPPDTSVWDVDVTHNLDSVLAETDICYLLRMQVERQSETLVPTMREYRSEFGLSAARAARLPQDAIIMHPGPMNRGVEIDGPVADLDRAVITEQVETGVAVRMAVLFLLLGSGLELVEGDLA